LKNELRNFILRYSFPIYLLAAAFCSACSQRSISPADQKKAALLTIEAAQLVRFKDNTDSAQKAISLLDAATSLDSNNFLAWENKLMFYYPLKQKEKLLEVYTQLIRIRPGAYDLYQRIGFQYDEWGDTVNAILNYNKAAQICKTSLDTMSTANKDYSSLAYNPVISLIMAGDSTGAAKLLKKYIHEIPSDNPGRLQDIRYLEGLSRKGIWEGIRTGREKEGGGKWKYGGVSI